MVICPCTSGTLAAIACGTSDNLLERAADVVIKEQRKLVLVPREMPLSAIHLEHMLKLARLGVVIMPASPGFYHHPESINDLVNFVVARILDHLAIAHDLVPRWGIFRARGYEINVNRFFVANVSNFQSEVMPCQQERYAIVK